MMSGCVCTHKQMMIIFHSRKKKTPQESLQTTLIQITFHTATATSLIFYPCPQTSPTTAVTQSRVKKRLIWSFLFQGKEEQNQTRLCWVRHRSHLQKRPVQRARRGPQLSCCLVQTLKPNVFTTEGIIVCFALSRCPKCPGILSLSTVRRQRWQLPFSIPNTPKTDKGFGSDWLIKETLLIIKRCWGQGRDS